MNRSLSLVSAALGIALVAAAAVAQNLSQRVPRDPKPSGKRGFIVQDVVGSTHRKADAEFAVSDKLDEAMWRLEQDGWTVVETEALENDNVLLLCEPSR